MLKQLAQRTQGKAVSARQDSNPTQADCGSLAHSSIYHLRLSSSSQHSVWHIVDKPAITAFFSPLPLLLPASPSSLLHYFSSPFSSPPLLLFCLFSFFLFLLLLHPFLSSLLLVFLFLFFLPPTLLFILMITDS